LTCKEEACIKLKRDNVFYILVDEEQRVSLDKFSNSYNFHRTILLGSRRIGYNVKFDYLPARK